jgi:hypothetical protein
MKAPRKTPLSEPPLFSKPGDQFEVRWIDSGRKARCASDPRHPDGTKITIPHKAGESTCTAVLPYPAPQCGYWLVKCSQCRMTAIITAAGRRDDPREVSLPCSLKAEGEA